MPLEDTGPSVVTLTGTNTRAVDQNGNPVTVSASQEAVKDFDWATIMAAASRDYDDGKFSPGNPPVLRVSSADCQRWIDDNA